MISIGLFMFRSKDEVKESSSDVVEIITWEGELLGDDPATKVAREIREEFDRTHLHIKVIRRTAPAGEERKVFATAMSGGTGPDLAVIPGVDTCTYIEQGFLADITEFIKNWDEVDQIHLSMLEPVKKDDRYFGLPAQYYVMMLVYRTDLFEQVGLNPDIPPKDWEEFVKYGQRLTDRSENRYGFGIRGDDLCAWHFIDYVWQAGGDFVEIDPETNRVKAAFADDAGVTAL